jgi:hypothetical protein
MDTDKDDRSIVEKTVEAVKEFAANISQAAHKTAEPEPNSKSGDEVVMLPMEATGLMGESVVPQFVVIRRPKKLTKKAPAKAAKKTAKKKSAKKAPTKATKKSVKKAKSPTGGKAVAKRTKKRTQKKKAKKRRR